MKKLTLFVLLLQLSVHSFGQDTSALITALNVSGDMTLLRGDHVIRYSSNATSHTSALTLATHLLQYSAENSAMFANSKIPTSLPFVRASIHVCDILALQAQLPGIGTFGSAGSDAVLGIALTGKFYDYVDVNDNKPSAYNGNKQEFQFYSRADNLFDISDNLLALQLDHCPTAAKLKLSSLYLGAEISREQAELIINELEYKP